MSNKIELQSRHFDAFFEVARTLHFGKAADNLCITASALSQRISTLEAQLQSKLFHRQNNSVSLTETGDRLLRYCQTVDTLQAEMLRDVGGSKNLGGTITIASFSSVSRSVIMPALQDLLLKHPELSVHFRVAHMYELKEILYRGQADFIVTQDAIDRAGYHSFAMGDEHNVLIERSELPRQDDTYLDHNQSDDFTERFLIRHDGHLNKALRRRFCDDIYGIIDAVQLGYGRGVVPVHMLSATQPVQLAGHYTKAWSTPVLLQYAAQDYYSAPFRAVRDTLIERGCQFLQHNKRQLHYHDMT